MKYTWLILASCLVIVLAELVPATQAGPYVDDGEFLDFPEKIWKNMLISTRKKTQNINMPLPVPYKNEIKRYIVKKIYNIWGL